MDAYVENSELKEIVEKINAFLESSKVNDRIDELARFILQLMSAKNILFSIYLDIPSLIFIFM